MVKKSATLHTRIEPSVKEQAEQILSTLGIPASSAINIFYKQIILHKGLPFAVQIPDKTPLIMEELSESQLHEELEAGYKAMLENKTEPAKHVFSHIRKISET